MTYDEACRVLKTSPTASADEIKEAYRTQAKRYHPDMHPTAEFDYYNQLMISVNEAKDVLLDTEKRMEWEKAQAHDKEERDEQDRRRREEAEHERKAEQERQERQRQEQARKWRKGKRKTNLRSILTASIPMLIGYFIDSIRTSISRGMKSFEAIDLLAIVINIFLFIPLSALLFIIPGRLYANHIYRNLPMKVKPQNEKRV